MWYHINLLKCLAIKIEHGPVITDLVTQRGSKNQGVPVGWYCNPPSYFFGDLAECVEGQSRDSVCSWQSEKRFRMLLKWVFKFQMSVIGSLSYSLLQIQRERSILWIVR